jgi:predicted nucleic acid-binding protein
LADYELRRELLRAGKSRSLQTLDALIATADYLPITTAAMRKAAEYWAQARNAGRPTAGSAALDGDVILAAQAFVAFGGNAVIATTNAKHLSRFGIALPWPDVI